VLVRHLLALHRLQGRSGATRSAVELT
jgi:hypothetical protein